MRMKIFVLLLYCGIVLLNLITGDSSEAQVGVFSKNDLVEYTALYKGERFPNGRPKVSDDILERLKDIAIEEAWSVLKNNGYYNQFEGDFVTTPENPKLLPIIYRYGRILMKSIIPKAHFLEIVKDVLNTGS